jgi:hypothetical protein
MLMGLAAGLVLAATAPGAFQVSAQQQQPSPAATPQETLPAQLLSLLEGGDG